MMITSVSSKGQATIPKALRDRYKIKPGTELQWEEDFESGTIRVYAVKEKEKEMTPQEAIEMLKGSDQSAFSLKDFLKEKQEEINLEDKKFSL